MCGKYGLIGLAERLMNSSARKDKLWTCSIACHPSLFLSLPDTWQLGKSK